MNLYQLVAIETPRLLIRPLQLGDEVLLHESIERSLLALERWMPWARNTDFSATQDFVARGVKHWQARTARDFPLLVIHKETQTVISASGFNEHTDLHKPCFEIGYWIDTTFAGQGLATELVNALTRYVLQALKAIRVQICTQINNKKSQAVAERCGYHFEAMMRNICLDCINRLPADGLLFSCCELSVLPPLEVTWQHHPEETPKTEQASIASLPTITMPATVLKTKKLSLSTLRFQDTDKLYMALMSSLDEAAPWFSWLHKHLSRRELQVHVNQAAILTQHSSSADYLYFLIWSKDQKHILGESWIKAVDWAVPNVHLAFWFDEKNIGNHDVCDVLCEMVKYAFTVRKAKCVQLYIPKNQATKARLVRRLGFTLEGVLKHYFKNYVTHELLDAESYSMLDISQLKKLD